MGADVARVSVVVPFLNPGEFLREAINSVLAQSYDDWELILVDDGSSDCSVEIARGFASKYPQRIRCISHPNRMNRGMAASRNLGLEHARGELISHLDADDVYTEDKLTKQVAVLDVYPEVAMVFGRMLVWSSWAGGRDAVQRFTCPVETVLKPPSFFRFLLSGKNDPAGYLIRKSAMDAVGGYPTGFEMCEDWGLYAKISLLYAVYVQTDCDYKYRQHGGQTCSVARQEGSFYAQFSPFFAWLDEYTRQEERGTVYVRLVVWFATAKYKALSVLERKTARLRRILRAILRPGTRNP